MRPVACAIGRLLPTLAVVLAGCAGLSASPRSPFSSHEEALKNLEAVYEPAAVVACIKTPLAAQGPCRDTIAQALLIVIDLRYADFELGFFDANRYGNFGATVATLGLTGAASVSGGGAARVLSAFAAGVTGTREAFSREVLAERTAVALQTAMRTRRDIVAVRIRDGLRLPAADYPFGVALSDLYAYFRAGTVLGALTGVNEAVATEARAARDRLGRVSAIASTPGAEELDTRFRATPTASKPAFLREIERVMRGLGISGTAMELIYDPPREADRQAVLREMAKR